ncbi:hypothetical protein Avbf_09423 [Armadillidium vulgare]|nr:hypothetical protein Avbf_09423 [Armadillidium vulgare]
MAESKIKNSNTSVEKQEQTMNALIRRVKCEERYLHMLMLNNDLAQDPVLPISPSAPPLLQTSGLEYEDSFSYMGSDATRPEHCFTSPSLSYAGNGLSLTNENIHQNAAATGNFRIGMASFPSDCDKLQSDFNNLQINSSEKKAKQESHSDMTEGVFEMDDFISPHAAVKYISEEEKESDDDDDEVFPEFSEEELNARKGFSARDLAKSVPLDVPAWPCAIDRRDRAVDTKRPKDPQEIAASMRELARSVRTSSVDVFGDLPRPNFASTAEFLP